MREEDGLAASYLTYVLVSGIFVADLLLSVPTQVGSPKLASLLSMPRLLAPCARDLADRPATLLVDVRD